MDDMQNIDLSGGSIRTLDTEGAQADIRRLLRYAVGRVRVQVPSDLISDSVAVMRVNSTDLTAEQEALLWRCVDRLTQAVSPATAASIKLVEEVEQHRRTNPQIFRRFWRDPEGRRQIAWARLMMLGLLVLVVAGQIYALVLSGIVANLATYVHDLQATKGEISGLHQANANLEENAEPLHSLMEKKETTEARIDGADRMLLLVSRPWGWVLGINKFGGADKTADEAASNSYILEEAAESVLAALALYILPVLYGALGAAAYILRRLNESVAECTFTIIAMLSYRLRLALGALLGLTIGLFVSPQTKVIPGASLSLVAMAFLAGYSVEVVFALLDSLVDRARQALRPAAADSAKPTSTEPAATDPTTGTSKPDTAVHPSPPTAEDEAIARTGNGASNG